MVSGMEIIGGTSCTTTPCEPCLKGKQTHTEIQKSTETRADTTLGCVFSNVCGKLPTRSHQGFLYFVTWIDDKSRKVSITGMREKSEVPQHLKAFVTHAELETGQCVKVLCTDGGGKYIGGKAQKYLEEKGIKHKIITPDTPQHNSVAKCMNQTLLDKVQMMLLDTSLPESYWFDTLQYATLLHNMTPEEAWSGNKPDMSHLCIFNPRAFVHIPDKFHGKLTAKSLICTFLGYA